MLDHIKKFINKNISDYKIHLKIISTQKLLENLLVKNLKIDDFHFICLDKGNVVISYTKPLCFSKIINKDLFNETLHQLDKEKISLFLKDKNSLENFKILHLSHSLDKTYLSFVKFSPKEFLISKKGHFYQLKNYDSLAFFSIA